MPIASYNQPNSYQELEMRPFELNYEAQLKELGAKNQYWMEGVNKIQSAYSKITGLNPQWTKNKEALKSFNDQAKEQIKKIASTDLGVQGNAEQVENVVAPLYDTSNPVSEAILLDDFHNKKGQALLKTIETYKTKDKGIYYSPTNEKYALEWYQDYIKKSNDPNASLEDLRKIKENVKGYTPYYDYNKDVMEAIKNCPENSSGSVKINGIYFQRTETKTKDVGPCVESMLNEKAISQMNIDGYVHFGKDYQSVGSKILSLSNKNAKKYSENLGEIAARLVSPNVTPEEKTSLTKQQKDIQVELARLNSLNTKLSSGDFSDIEKNYEFYAGFAQRSDIISKLGESYSKHEDDSDIEVNPAELLRIRLEHESVMDYNDKVFTHNENALKMNHAEKLAMINQSGKTVKQKEEFPAEIVTPGVATKEGKDIEVTRESFLENGKNIKDSLHETETELFSYIYKNYGNDVKLDTRDPRQMESFVRNILEKDPKAKADTRVQSYLNQYEKKKMQVDLWNTLYTNIQENIKKEAGNGTIPVKVLVSGREGLVSNPQYAVYNIPVKDLKNYITKTGTDEKTFIGGVSIPNSYFFTEKDSKGKIGRKFRVVNQDVIDKSYKNIETITNKYYATAVTPTTMLMSNERQNADENDVFRRQLLTTFSSYIDPETKKPSISKLSDIRLGRTDWQGKVEVYLPGVTGDDGITKLRSLGYTAEEVSKGNFIIKDAKEFNSPNADKMLPTMISLSMDKIKNTSYPPQQEVPILTTYKNKYRVFTIKSTPGIIYVRDLTKGVKSSPVYNTENISELTETLLNLPR